MRYIPVFVFSLIGLMFSTKREPVATKVSVREGAMFALANGQFDRMVAESHNRYDAGKQKWIPQGFKLLVDSLNRANSDSVRAGELWLAYLDLQHALSLRIDTLVGCGDYTMPAEVDVDVLLLHTTGSRRPEANAHAQARVQCRKGWARKNPRSWNFSVDDTEVFMSYDPSTTRTWHVRADSETPVNSRSASVEICQFDGILKAPATSNGVALFVRLSWQFPNAIIEIHRDVDPRKGRHKGCPSLYSDHEVERFKNRVNNALQLWKDLRNAQSMHHSQIPPP